MNAADLFICFSQDDSCIVKTGTEIEVPRIDVGTSVRVAPLARQWCGEQNVTATFITTIGGVGRADGSMHWGAWLRLDQTPQVHARQPLSAIEAHAENSTTRRLASALAAIRSNGRASTWIGRNPEWPEIITAWMARTHRGRRVGPIVPIRSDMTTIVARSSIDGQTVFFTTRPHPFHDVDIRDALDTSAPGIVPRTIAHDRTRGWWLTAHVGSADLKTQIEKTDQPARHLSEVMTEIANAQITTIHSIDLERLSFVVSRASVLAGVERAMNESNTEASWTDPRRASLLSGVDVLWEETHADAACIGWIHSDPSPDNVRVDDDGTVRFIDMEDPWYGPLPLMGALVLHSMCRRCGWTNQQWNEISARSWRRYVEACGLVAERHGFGEWLRLAQLVRLIRRVDRSAAGPTLLLHEETPRRSRAIAAELQRFCVGS